MPDFHHQHHQVVKTPAVRTAPAVFCQNKSRPQQSQLRGILSSLVVRHGPETLQFNALPQLPTEMGRPMPSCALSLHLSGRSENRVVLLKACQRHGAPFKKLLSDNSVISICLPVSARKEQGCPGREKKLYHSEAFQRTAHQFWA